MMPIGSGQRTGLTRDLDFATTSPEPYGQTRFHISATVSTYTGAPLWRLPVYEL